MPRRCSRRPTGSAALGPADRAHDRAAMQPRGAHRPGLQLPGTAGYASTAGRFCSRRRAAGLRKLRSTKRRDTMSAIAGTAASNNDSSASTPPLASGSCPEADASVEGRRRHRADERPSAVTHPVTGRIGKVGEDYVEGRIDIDGSMRDVMALAAELMARRSDPRSTGGGGAAGRLAGSSSFALARSKARHRAGGRRRSRSSSTTTSRTTSTTSGSTRSGSIPAPTTATPAWLWRRRRKPSSTTSAGS